MNQLLEIGFERAGHWSREGDLLRCDLIRHAMQKNVLYAMVVDGVAKYVGKTTQRLGARMRGYEHPGPTQSTNVRNHRLILDALRGGATVDIFALPDNGLMKFGDFHLNLAAGLEDDIIRKLKPEWNGARRKSVDPTELPPQVPIATFRQTIRSTYYRFGFFNPGVAHSALFGGDGEAIEIFRGESSQPILGTIDRRSNANNSPRIFGGTELRDWFRATISDGDELLIEVYSPVSIRLRVEPHRGVGGP